MTGYKIYTSILFFALLATTSYGATENTTREKKQTTSQSNTTSQNVNTSTTEQDKLITHKISQAIKNSPSLRFIKIDVQTNRGIVTLTGSVDSDSQASTIIELAQRVIGVLDIDTSNLKVANSTQPFQDMVITARVIGLLIRDDIASTSDVASLGTNVETNNGIVYLTGVVDNQAQIQNAINLIKGIPGVIKVVYSMKKVVGPVPENANTTSMTNDGVTSTFIEPTSTSKASTDKNNGKTTQ